MNFIHELNELTICHGSPDYSEVTERLLVWEHTHKGGGIAIAIPSGYKLVPIPDMEGQYSIEVEESGKDNDAP